MRDSRDVSLFAELSSAEQANISGGASYGFSIDLDIDNQAITFEVVKRAKQSKRNKRFVAKLNKD